MSRLTKELETVARCVARQDGSWLIVTRKGRSGVSLVEMPTGAVIVIRDGKAMRHS